MILKYIAIFVGFFFLTINGYSQVPMPQNIYKNDSKSILIPNPNSTKVDSLDSAIYQFWADSEIAPSISNELPYMYVIQHNDTIPLQKYIAMKLYSYNKNFKRVVFVIKTSWNGELCEVNFMGEGEGINIDFFKSNSFWESVKIYPMKRHNIPINGSVVLPVLPKHR